MASRVFTGIWKGQGEDHIYVMTFNAAELRVGREVPVTFGRHGKTAIEFLMGKSWKEKADGGKVFTATGVRVSVSNEINLGVTPGDYVFTFDHSGTEASVYFDFGGYKAPYYLMPYTMTATSVLKAETLEAAEEAAAAKAAAQAAGDDDSSSMASRVFTGIWKGQGEDHIYVMTFNAAELRVGREVPVTFGRHGKTAIEFLMGKSWKEKADGGKVFTATGVRVSVSNEINLGVTPGDYVFTFDHSGTEASVYFDFGGYKAPYYLMPYTMTATSVLKAETLEAAEEAAAAKAAAQAAGDDDATGTTATTTMSCGQVFDENGKVKAEFTWSCAGDPTTPESITGEYINTNPYGCCKETMKVAPYGSSCFWATVYYDCCPFPSPCGCTPYYKISDGLWLGMHPLCFFEQCISKNAEGLWYHSLCLCCVIRGRWDKVPEDDELYEAFEVTKEETAWNTLVGSPVFGGNSPADAFANVAMDTLAVYGGDGIYGELAVMGFNTFDADAAATHEAVYASVEETLGGAPLSKQELYEKCKVYETVVASKSAFEETKMSKMSPSEKKEVLLKAERAMCKHRGEYDKLFQPWSQESWIGFLKDQHGKLNRKASLKTNPAQPNPWAGEGIPATSKKYLVNLMGVFADTSASSPTQIAEDACKKVVEFMGEDVAEFRRGPLKGKRRVFEKVLMHGGRFDQIRDYARNYIVIKKGQFDDMPLAPIHFARQKEVDVVRAKNRFDPSYDAKASSGYRDYQIILKTKKGGWLVEVQVIPEEMLELKESLGHEDYTDYRVIVEAANRQGSK